MRRRLVEILLVPTVSLACSERTLTAERAARLIGDLDQFKREAHFTIETAFRSRPRLGAWARLRWNARL